MSDYGDAYPHHRGDYGEWGGTKNGGFSSYYDLEPLVENIKSIYVQAAMEAAIDAVQRAAALGLRRVAQLTGQTIDEIAKNFAEEDANTRQAMFQRLGELAQETMLRSYDQTVTSKKGSAGDYRESSRYVNKMRGALGSPEFFNATPAGLEWGNKEFLDRTAAQWHRLNFGAEPAASGSSPSFSFEFGGSTGTLQFDDGPSPAFSLPQGGWFSEGRWYGSSEGRRGMDEFWPVRRSASALESGGPTRGIKARHFMDAGLRKMADELPVLMKEYVDSQFKGLSRVRKVRRASVISRLSTKKSVLDIQLP